MGCGWKCRRPSNCASAGAFLRRGWWQARTRPKMDTPTLAWQAQRLPAQRAVLALGHSSRDTFALLHDVGHGPFSHALEHVLIEDVHHEEISLLIFEHLNKEFKGALDMAISIFKGTYPKLFLHQLISSQLDVDRMDYLTRDSFYSGVSEGVIGYDRIIKMMVVHNNELMVEEKAVYSIEKFLVARRLMYWQAYLHKTVLSAENMLVKILDRARVLAKKEPGAFSSNPILDEFFRTTQSAKFIKNNLAKFC